MSDNVEQLNSRSEQDNRATTLQASYLHHNTHGLPVELWLVVFGLCVDSPVFLGHELRQVAQVCGLFRCLTATMLKDQLVLHAASTQISLRDLLWHRKIFWLWRRDHLPVRLKQMGLVLTFVYWQVCRGMRRPIALGSLPAKEDIRKLEFSVIREPTTLPRPLLKVMNSLNYLETLVMKGCIYDKTIHTFVCHWPSLKNLTLIRLRIHDAYSLSLSTKAHAPLSTLTLFDARSVHETQLEVHKLLLSLPLSCIKHLHLKTPYNRITASLMEDLKVSLSQQSLVTLELACTALPTQGLQEFLLMQKSISTLVLSIKSGVAFSPHIEALFPSLKLLDFQGDVPVPSRDELRQLTDVRLRGTDPVNALIMDQMISIAHSSPVELRHLNIMLPTDAREFARRVFMSFPCLASIQLRFLSPGYVPNGFLELDVTEALYSLQSCQKIVIQGWNVMNRNFYVALGPEERPLTLEMQRSLMLEWGRRCDSLQTVGLSKVEWVRVGVEEWKVYDTSQTWCRDIPLRIEESSMFTTMHDALAVNDIILDLSSYLPNRDLLHLCLTCKGLYSILIGQLWRTITTIRPLLSLKPRVEASGDKIDNTFVYPKPDWNRFRRHAALIHTFVLDDFRRWRGLEFLLTDIYRVEPQIASMFPHLRRLIATIHSKTELVASLPLLSLPLDHMAFYVPAYYVLADIEWQRYADALLKPIPELKHFELATTRAGVALLPADVPDSIPTVIACLSQCRFVRMEWIDLRTEHFFLLAELPNTIHMHIGLSQEICDNLRDSATSPSSSTSFSMLSTLGLDAQSVLAPVLLPVLRCVSSRTLSALHLHQWDLSTVLGALPLVVSKWSLTLKEFRFTSSSRSPSSAITSFSDFQPLLSCPAIEVFELTDKPSVDFEDGAIEAFGVAWSNLKVFSLTGGSAFNGHREKCPRTLWSFISLSQRCRNLRELALDVDFNVHVPLPESEISRSPLVFLNVGQCRCPAWVTGVLRKFIFPNLQTFRVAPIGLVPSSLTLVR